MDMMRPQRIDAVTVDRRLAAQGSRWQRVAERLVLVSRFACFADAISFVNEVAALAEARDHHPDIEIHYNEVRLVLWTHDIGGLTELDLDLASAILKR
jgi:4a-hydroxytetrahydrobiopterin dehydratase